MSYEPSSPLVDKELFKRLLPQKIIASSLIAGEVIFLGIALYIVHVVHNGQGMRQLPQGPLISFGVLLFPALIFPLAFIMPLIIGRMQVRRLAASHDFLSDRAQAETATAAGMLADVFTTVMIVRFALVEGAAFSAIIAYILESQEYTLAVAGAAVLIQLAFFPTETRLRGWIQNQKEWLAQSQRVS